MSDIELDIEELVGRWLVAKLGSLDVGLDAPIDLSERWLDEDINVRDAELAYPHGRFRIDGGIVRMQTRPGRQDIITREVVEEHTFLAGTLIYDAGEKDIAPDTSTVTGTLNGVAHSFEESTDYVVEAGPGYEDPATLTRLRWLEDGDTPDPDTVFTWTYSEQLIEERRVTYRLPDVVLTLRAKQQGGLPAARLVKRMGRAIEKVLMLEKGSDLTTTAEQDGGGTLILGPYQVIGSLPLAQGDTTAAWVIEFGLALRTQPVTRTTQRVRRISGTLQVTEAYELFVLGHWSFKEEDAEQVA